MKQGIQTKRGIFGNVQAWGDAVEEQGRKSLHSHMIVFIENFDRLITMLWSNDTHTRDCAKDEILSYFEKVMSSSYDILPQSFSHQSKTTTKQDNSVEKETSCVDCTENDNSITTNCIVNQQVSQCKGSLIKLPKQNYRDMHHRKHGKQYKGMVSRCTSCNNLCTTKQMIWNAIMTWHDAAQKEYPDYFKSDISFPLTKEEIHVIALRFSLI